MPISQLKHRPVISIACGVEFTVITLVGGNCYSWGVNSCGQLGLGDQITRLRPELIRNLKVIKAKKVSCGAKHSIVISPIGIVFGFGSNAYNEIGLGHDVKFESFPKKIERLSEYHAIDVCCGSSHTLVLTRMTNDCKNSKNRVYAFGLNSSGQLGLGHQQAVSNIQQVVFDETIQIIGLSSGPLSMSSFFFTEGVPIKRSTLPSVDLYSIEVSVRNVKNNTVNAVTALRESVAFAFSSISVLNASFRLSQTSNQVLVDLSSIREAYNLLFTTENEQVISTLGRALIQVSDHLKEVPFDDVSEDLSVFFIVLENPLLLRPTSYHIATERIINGILALPKLHRLYFFTQFKHFPSEYFLRVITVLQTYISFCISAAGCGLDYVAAILVLSSLHEANKEAKIVVEKFFYNEDISKRKDMLLQEWYKFTVDKDQRVFNLWQYPFIIDVVIKNSIIHAEFDNMKYIQASTHLRKYNQMIINHSPSELIAGIILSRGVRVMTREDSSIPIIQLELSVRREHLLEDILLILSDVVHNDINALKLPLKCNFSDEEASDQGGVAAEMLTLAIQAIVEQNFLSPCSSQHLMWFTNCDSLSISANCEPLDSLEFTLGLLVGLASYHGVFVHVPLPKYIYNIESCSLTIEDLFYVDSALANGLKQLLDYDFSENLLEITFTASSNPLVENNAVYCDLLPDGANIQVTRTNKAQFASLFINHALYGSCKRQVDNYLLGLRVCFSDAKVLKCCTTSEIENIILGQDEIGDLSELRLRTIYSGAYHDEHPIIEWFWSVLSDFKTFEKRRFLHFVSGSSRTPCGGIRMLKLIIQSVPSTTLLPSAHTCFNILDLPMYLCKEHLEEKLKLCLEHYKGFGLI